MEGEPTRADFRRGRSAEFRRREMGDLPALASRCQHFILSLSVGRGYIRIATHNDLGVWALRNRRLHQRRHGGGTRLAAAHQEPGDVGRVVDALKGEVAGADGGREGREEGGPGEGADVAGFGGAAREDDGHGLAGLLVNDVVLGGGASGLAGGEFGDEVGGGGGGREGETHKGEDGERGLHGEVLRA